MTKIVSAVNAMIRNSKKITEVLVSSNGDIFFEYDGKHKWSIGKRDENVWLWFYPGDISVHQLANYEDYEWDGVPMVAYDVSELNTREARESFDELYILAKEKVYGLDDVLNEIIEEGADDIPF